ncbi:hypothetical protein HYV71_00795 [Candidatus Uhrbacteria bacterium]|nr:hypothetical protein [Candidatus Uhrbacteria bacterium]
MFDEKKPEEALPPEEQKNGEPVDMFSQESGTNSPPGVAADQGQDEQIEESTTLGTEREESTEEYEDSGSGSGKRHMILALIAIVALVLVIGGGVGLIFLFKPKQAEQPTVDLFSIPVSDNGIPTLEDQPVEDQAGQPIGENQIVEEEPPVSEGSPPTGQADTIIGQADTIIQGDESAPVIIDTDGDGLPDEQEAQYGTNPNLFDTDGDGLSDREELMVYGTDPLNADSDKDGFLDGEEIKNGYDPNGAGKLPSVLPIQ